MPVSLRNQDQTTNLYNLFDRMQPGEVYAPDATGSGGTYVVPEQRYVADETGQVNDLSPFQQRTGVLDAMTSRTADANASRLADISAGTGAAVQGADRAITFDQAAVDRFNKLSPADQMAAEMVQSGRMSPKEYYAIAKKAEVDNQRAMLDYLSKIDPTKNKVDLMQGGKPVPMSAANVSDAMSTSGNTAFQVGAPYPGVNYTFYEGKSGAGAGTGKKDLSDFDYKLRRDPIIMKNSGVLAAARDLDLMLNSGNPIAMTAFGTKMAKLSGEVGNLALQEQQQYKGSQALASKLMQGLKTATSGTLTDENRKAALELVSMFQSTAEGVQNGRIQSILSGHAYQTKIPETELLPIAEAYGFKPPAPPAEGSKAYATEADAQAALDRNEIMVGDSITIGGRPVLVK